MSVQPILDVRGLTVSVELPSGRRAKLVDDIDFSIPPGGALGLVGESGSGKTMTSLAIIGLLAPATEVEAGEVLLEGEDLLKKSKHELQKLRGKRMSMVLQDALTALDPSFTIRTQLAAPLRQHRGLRGAALEKALVDALERVHLPASAERLNQYPHQLSGGMRQRVVIAMALSCNPALLVADEPTTALDVTVQAQILDLLHKLRRNHGSAIVFITHDMGVMAEIADRMLVMYAGRVVERGTKEELFRVPMHPYTQALLDSIPPLTGEKPRRLRAIPGTPPILLNRPPGCAFAPRCAQRFEKCSAEPELGNGERAAACFRVTA